MRFDQWLAKKYPEKSRSFWQKKIKSGQATINGEKASPHAEVSDHDQIQLNLVTEENQLTSEDIPLNILFEDPNYAIVNKPAGMVVHPGNGNQTGTLANALLHHFKSLSKTEGNRPGIVHRLDKDTSGLIVVAKNEEAHKKLSQQFQNKAVDKKYMALVEGRPTPSRGSIEAPLTRSAKNRKAITVSNKRNARYALTHYKVVAQWEKPFPCALLEVKIETGRTHQIRVHLNAIGHPIVGDKTYGKPKINAQAKTLGLDRQFLNAVELEFLSPTTEKRVKYTCQLAEDLALFQRRLEEKAGG